MRSLPIITRAVRRRVAIAALVVAPAVALAGQIRPRDQHWTAPPDEAATPNPLAGHEQARAGGAKLFQQRCATCHGADGRGTKKAPALADPGVQAQTDGELFWKISSGNTRAGMPAFSFLPEPQRWQLVLHVRALSTGTSQVSR